MSTRHLLFSRFSWLFQLSEDLIGTHATGKQFLQDGFRLCFLCFLCGLSIFLCLLRFQGCHFFFGLLQSSVGSFRSQYITISSGFTDAFLHSSPHNTSIRQSFHRLCYRRCLIAETYPSEAIIVASQCLSKR